MGSTGIISHAFNADNLSKLKRLMASSSFLWSDEQLIDYIAGYLTNGKEKQLFVEENNKFVGCNLFMSTKASISNRMEVVRWSHSTYLMNEYRKKYGLDLILKTFEYKNIFGFGLTGINNQIHKYLGSRFLNPSVAYVMTVNDSKYNHLPNIRNNTFKIGANTFKKVNRAGEIVYPHNGIWNGEIMDVDFVRDEDFVHRRFFKSPNNYSIYSISTPFSHDRLYFVTRIRKVKGEMCLFLVDYRFSIDDGEAFDIIVSALEVIAKAHKIHTCYLFSTLEHSLSSSGLNINEYGEKCQIVTNIKSLAPTNVFITPADSDCELIPFDKNEDK